MDGIINLDKPAGISSAQALNRIKRLLPLPEPPARKRPKIGHAGTLDPFATGVLVVLIGKCTKLCESMMDKPKAYNTTIRLGATTETLDPESDIIATPKAEPVELAAIETLMPKFIGEIQQMPPAYSALKLQGKPAYQRVRDGEEVELQPRTVNVYGLELISYEWPDLTLNVRCGRGFYVRSLARDIGEQLGVGGYLTQLRRTQVGDYLIDNAVTLEKVLNDGVEAHLTTS